jgi:hypothetical protein
VQVAVTGGLVIIGERDHIRGNRRALSVREIRDRGAVPGEEK